MLADRPAVYILKYFDVLPLARPRPMQKARALAVSGPLSALMHRCPARPDPLCAPTRPEFTLPQFPAVEPGPPLISVHCFLTHAVQPNFSHNSRAVFKFLNDPRTGATLKTKFTFKSVTAERLPLISRNLDRAIVAFLTGNPFIFVCVSRERLSLSDLSRFILDTNGESQGAATREFEVRIPGSSPCPLIAEESFDREFTQIRLKVPPFPVFSVLNLFTDLGIRQFSEVLNQLRTQTPCQSENANFRALFPFFAKQIQLITFLFTEIGNEFLLCAFAEKKKSVIEKPRPEREFAVDPSAFARDAVDPSAVMVDRAAAEVGALKAYVEAQLSGGDAPALLAQLDASERANAAQRERIAEFEAEIAGLERAVAELRERDRLRADVEREGREVADLRAVVGDVILRTDALRGRYEAAIAALRLPVERRRPLAAENDSSAANSPVPRKAAAPARTAGRT
jgi:hypothetical protein